MSGTSLQRRLDAVLHGISICGIYLFTYPNIYFQISISQNPHIQRNLVWLLVFSPVWLLVFSLVWLLGFSPVWLLVSGTSCWEDLMPWDMASALVAWCTRGHCLAVTERESPSDLALLDFISAPPGATKDIELVDRKLSQPSSAKWRVENWPKSIVTESPLKAQSSDGNWLLTFTFYANEGQANEKVNSPPRILMLELRAPETRNCPSPIVQRKHQPSYSHRFFLPLCCSCLNTKNLKWEMWFRWLIVNEYGFHLKCEIFTLSACILGAK